MNIDVLFSFPRENTSQLNGWLINNATLHCVIALALALLPFIIHLPLYTYHLHNPLSLSLLHYIFLILLKIHSALIKIPLLKSKHKFLKKHRFVYRRVS
jgi:hypothetical protein